MNAKNLVFVIFLASGSAYAKTELPAELQKTYWSQISLEVDSSGKNLRGIAPDEFGRIKLKDKDKVTVTLIGAKGETAPGEVSLKNGSLFVHIKDAPDAWTKRNWNGMRGFFAVVLSGPGSDKIWADRYCSVSLLPDARGVTCESMNYQLKTKENDTPIFASFSYGTKGEFNNDSGVFTTEYIASKEFIRNAKGKWEQWGKEIRP